MVSICLLAAFAVATVAFVATYENFFRGLCCNHSGKQEVSLVFFFNLCPVVCRQTHTFMMLSCCIPLELLGEAVLARLGNLHVPFCGVSVEYSLIS